MLPDDKFDRRNATLEILSIMFCTFSGVPTPEPLPGSRAAVGGAICPAIGGKAASLCGALRSTEAGKSDRVSLDSFDR
jgi:hypothetical protein